MKLEQLKSKLSYLKKNKRPILNMIQVLPNGLQCTDLETDIKIKNNYGLNEGLQKLDALGLLPSDKSLEGEFPQLFITNKHARDNVTVKINDLFYCLKFASSDETRLYLNCVAFDNSNMVAIDGHTMKTYKTEQLSESYLIPKTSLKVLEGLIKGFKIKETITFSFDDSFAYSDNEFFSFKARLIKREFPKWQTVVPVKFKYNFLMSDLPSLKTIKPLLNPRTSIIKIVSENKKLTLVIPDQDLSYPIGEYQGENFQLGINMNYLERACNGEKLVCVKFNNELSPLEINNAIVMPMKI
jgi:DNA polymerase III sliding clamp (beta) subunit (PCNA family)